MSSYASGHGELHHHQHVFAFALMFFAVALAMLMLVVATHRVTDRSAGRAPGPSGVTACHNLPGAGATIRYCVDE